MKTKIAVELMSTTLFQGDMRVAFMSRDLNGFQKLLYRTGYKNYLQQNDNIVTTNSLLSCLKIRKFRTSRNLLFEHDENRESLFEEILKKQGKGNSEFISLVWTECELWRNKDILMQTNSNGKLPIDYIIESNDDGNLFAFLVFDFKQESDSVTKTSKNYFLKFKNDQFTEKTGMSLFQKIYSIIDPDSEEICYEIIKKLLTEMQQIIDIQGETAIDDVLKMENASYKHNILKILLTYWKIYSKEYSYYKAVLSDLSPYYNLLLTLKEGHEYVFEEMYPQYIDIMKEKCGDDEYVDVVREDSNSLLEYALNNGQRRAMTAIIECPIIDPNKVSIKLDESSVDNQNAHFLMSKLLDRGYYLGNQKDGNQVPIDWISPQVFEDFLDSKVKEDGEELVNVDILNSNLLLIYLFV